MRQNEAHFFVKVVLHGLETILTPNYQLSRGYSVLFLCVFSPIKIICRAASAFFRAGAETQLV